MRNKKIKPEVVIQLDRRFRISPRMIFTLLLFFIGCMGLALTFAMITEVRHKISEARVLLDEKKDENLALRSEISQKYSLEEIERIALGRLGMNKPDSSQIIHIYVPRQSHSELSADKEPEPETLWDTVATFFKNLISFE